MNTNEEIESMAMIMSPIASWGVCNCSNCDKKYKQFCSDYKNAKHLVAEGYGNKKQAVSEYIDKLKELFKEKHQAVITSIVCCRADELYKELYGDDTQ